jgi:ABC-2 type transport system ATP-binding protein
VEGFVILLDGIRFRYPGGPIVVEVDRLELGPGLTLLLGPNGAGKSTLLRMIAGVERPGQGRIAIHGHDLWSEEIASRKLLAYVPEQPELTPYATVREILQLVCRLRGVAEAEGSRALERVGLATDAARSVRQMSQGQRRRAVLAAALVGTPPVLLLDEPLEAMDRVMRDEIVAWIHGAVEQGRTVIAASHEFDDFAEIARAALAVRGGVAALHPLPADPVERSMVLDRLARGLGGE